jgi:hypothetical protein
MRLRRLLPLLLLLLLPASARADGLPPTSLDARQDGVVELGGDRFTALPTGGSTVLTRSELDGGRIVGIRVLDGSWGVPVVAYDGTSSGLSADASMLVLKRVGGSYPHKSSSFAVVDTRRLTVRRTIAMRGEWGFDALSPDGSLLYLIHVARRDLRRYSVRAYDLAAGRLLPDPVVDPSEPDEPMRGLPATRVTGPGGRWEYTLYLGGHEPFVHALDTVRRESICIDLPRRVAHHRRMWQLRLVLRGSRVVVVNGTHVVASAPRRPQTASAGGGPPWLAAVAVLAGLGAALGARRAIRSR